MNNTNDFIRRGDAIEAVHDRICQIGYERNKSVLSIRQAVRDVTAADVVEVVRCKECKYYYAWPDDYRTCHKHYQIDGATTIMGAMGYCSDAIRRKDDDAQGSL